MTKPHEETWTPVCEPDGEHRVEMSAARELVLHDLLFVADAEQEAVVKLAAASPAMARLLLEMRSDMLDDDDCVGGTTAIDRVLRAAGVLPDDPED